METRGAGERRPATLPRPPGTGVLAPLLVVAVFLLCHGVFGSLHLSQGDPDLGPSRTGLPHGEHAPDGGEGSTGGHAAWGASCAAVLAAVLFGAGLALLGFISRQSARDGALRRAPILPSPPPHLPRGPTASVLQVFRL